jgi:hypothetical protein
LVFFHREVCLCRLHFATSLCAIFLRPALCFPFCFVMNSNIMRSLCCFQYNASNSTTNQPFLASPTIISPTTPTTLPFISDIGPGVQQTPEPRVAPLLCDHRYCLRHKQSCLEHPPTPPSTQQCSYRRRRISVEMSRRADADMWVRVGTEFASGSCGETLSRTV